MKQKRISALLLIFALVLLLVPTSIAFAAETKQILYINADGEEITDTATAVSGTAQLENDGLYYFNPTNINEDETNTAEFTVNGTANLILCDNAYNLTITKISGNGTLNIYAGTDGNQINAYKTTVSTTVETIENVDIKLYGGSFSSLPTNGWSLGDEFCFEYVVLDNDYNDIFSWQPSFRSPTADESFAIVKCPTHTYDKTTKDGKCTLCGFLCPHTTEQNGECADCGTCMHEDVNGNSIVNTDTGICGRCQIQLPIKKVFSDGTTEWSFSNLEGSSDGFTITLFGDVINPRSACGNGKLYLNGHTITDYDNRVVCQPNIGIRGTLHIYSGNAENPIGTGKIEGTLYVNNDDHKDNQVIVHEGVSFTLSSNTLGNSKAVANIAGVEDTHDLYCTSLWSFYSGKFILEKGVNIGHGIVAEKTNGIVTVTLKDFLAEGVAYADAEGNILEIDDDATYLLSRSENETYQTVACTHHNKDGKLLIGENNVCTACRFSPSFTIWNAKGENGQTTVTVSIPKAGTYTLILADYEGGGLNKAKVIAITTTEDNKIVTTEPLDVTLGTDDKVILLDNLDDITPLCDVYVIN